MPVRIVLAAMLDQLWRRRYTEGDFLYILFFIALLIRSLFVLVFFEDLILRLALVLIIIVLALHG
jgi:tryptophan-rich sensory protein